MAQGGDTRIKPGEIRNPHGRPKGIRDKRAIFRDMLEAKAPELVQKAIDMALAGDASAMRLCIDKILPTLKQIDADVDVRHSLDDLPLERLLARHEELLAQLQRLAPDSGAEK